MRVTVNCNAQVYKYLQTYKMSVQCGLHGDDQNKLLDILLSDNRTKLYTSSSYWKSFKQYNIHIKKTEKEIGTIFHWIHIAKDHIHTIISQP